MRKINFSEKRVHTFDINSTPQRGTCARAARRREENGSDGSRCRTPAVTLIVTSHALYLSHSAHDLLMKYASRARRSSCARLLRSAFSPLPHHPHLLSMNIRASSPGLVFYVCPSLRLLFLSGFFFPSRSLPVAPSLPPPSLSLPLTLPTRSFSHCIHFCAFKKSPRITNLEESDLTRGTQGRVEEPKGKQTRTDRVSRMFRHASKGFLEDGSDGLDRN